VNRWKSTPALAEDAGKMLSSAETPDRFVTIHGPKGEFKIAKRPRRREEDGWTYVYQDAAHKFTFVGNWNDSDTVYVRNAKKFSDGSSPVQFTEPEEVAIKENISYFFRTRNIILIQNEVEPGSRINSVEFSWGVLR
jgi:hypothetical protein